MYLGRALMSGHWPTLLAAWLHLTVSFMVWLMLGALAGYLARDLSLTVSQLTTAVAIPLLAGAGLRVVAGWSSDRLGAKPTALAILLAELGAILWGWRGVDSYAELLGLGALLGVAGASFAVTLPLAGLAYPQRHRGLVVGLAASGNIGAVLIAFLAPRWAESLGWQQAFGVMTLPVIVTLVLFLRWVPSGEGRPVDSGGRWWHALYEVARQPTMYWLCSMYAVTFGGFVGFCSVLPLMLHDQYDLDLVTAGGVTALAGLTGSLIRPFGGYAADRMGGLWALQPVCPMIVVVLIALGALPAVATAVGLIVLTVTAMGFGNGVVFQLVADWFPKQIGLASGIVGAAGGVGGFLFPMWLGVLKEVTGSYRAGLWLFAVIGVVASASAVTVLRRRITG
ncbi:MFS transporter [Candidatus Nitrospira bockiana]